MNKTKIGWTDRTINPVRARDPQTGAVGHHCEHAGQDCWNCYASKMQPFLFRLPVYDGRSRRDRLEHFLDEKELHVVRRLKRPQKIFWEDMADLFGEWVREDWIRRCLEVMRDTPWHTHQVLTKRPARLRQLLTGPLAEFAALANVWWGVSVGYRGALPRLEVLRQAPVATRFLSAEPLLEDLGRVDLSGIAWVIVGGESGRPHRPLPLEALLNLVGQTRAAGVPCWVKQDSAPTSERQGRIPDDVWAIKEFPVPPALPTASDSARSPWKCASRG
jgi:protein gp37